MRSGHAPYLMILFLLALFLAIPCPPAICLAEDAVCAPSSELTVVTEEWPPYNYSKDGQLSGVVTEIIRATLDRAGVKYTISVLPWARAYKTALEQENVLIYTIFKLPNREESFKWIKIDGLSVNMHLFRPKNRTNIEVRSLESAKQYRIGVTRDTSTHHYLLSKGFEEGLNLFPVSNELLNVLKSQQDRHRIDLTTGDRLSQALWLKEAGFPHDYWQEVLFLFKEDFYMAFSHSTPDETVERVRHAFEQIKAEGEVQELESKYYRMYQ